MGYVDMSCDHKSDITLFLIMLVGLQVIGSSLLLMMSQLHTLWHFYIH